MRTVRKQNRELLFFLSGPFDMEPYKDVLQEVIARYEDIFHDHGLQLRVWRSTCTTPELNSQGPMGSVRQQMPKSFDVYVGLLGSRLGTPTDKALSGTLEEFQIARQMTTDTGRPPWFFFYFQKPDSSQPLDDERRAVGKFRCEYPGLYFDFSDEADLKECFIQHLVRIASRELFDCPRARQRPWESGLATLTSESDATHNTSLLKHGSEQARKDLSILVGLFDLEADLSDIESDLLVAAIYLHRLLRACVPGDVLAHAENIVNRTGGDFARTAMEIATAAARDAVIPLTHPLESHDCRCRLLSALVQLAYAIGLDHQAIRVGTDFDLRAREGLVSVDEWLAFLTERTGVAYRGVVTLHVRVPHLQESLAQELTFAVNSRFDWRWQRLRPALTESGFAVARTRTCCFPSYNMPILHQETLDTLAAAARAAKDAVVRRAHLGEELRTKSLPNSTIRSDIADLLPLPDSILAKSWLLVRAPQSANYVLQLKEVADNGAPVSPLISVGGQLNGLSLTPDGLKAGTRYRWDLLRDDGDFQSVVRSGCVITMSDRHRLMAILEERGPILRDALAREIGLGLRSETVERLWPQLTSGGLDREELLWLNAVFGDACDWVERHAGTTTTVELYRDACNCCADLLNKETRS